VSRLGGRCGGATAVIGDESVINGRGQTFFSPKREALRLFILHGQSCELKPGSSFMKFPRAPISHLVYDFLDS